MIDDLNNIALSLASSFIYDVYKRFKFKEEGTDEDFNVEIQLLQEKIVSEVNYRTFHVIDIERILSFVEDPVIHFIIDDVPKFYFSVAVVIESRITNEWYIIKSGEIAFQGTGGGYNQSKVVCDLLKKYKLPFAIWCSTENLLSQFEYRKLGWTNFKSQLIPFLSVNNTNEYWKDVTARINELFPALEAASLT